MNAEQTFAAWLNDVKPCPPIGEGVHPYILSASIKGLSLGITDEDTLEGMIESAIVRDPRRNEIRDAIRKAKAILLNVDYNAAPPKWPKADKTAQRCYARIGRDRGITSLIDLWELSPASVMEHRSEAIIEAMFGPSELVCCAMPDRRAFTRTRKEFRGYMDRYTHLVPSPMTRPKGVSQEGNESPRTLDNTGRRRFLIVEFDGPSLELQSQLLWGLAVHCPLALVVFSGNKSLHGWFYVEPWGEEKAMEFFRLAVACGADRAMWTRCQLVRMPGAKNEKTGAVQGVEFWNPFYAKGNGK